VQQVISYAELQPDQLTTGHEMAGNRFCHCCSPVTRGANTVDTISNACSPARQQVLLVSALLSLVGWRAAEAQQTYGNNNVYRALIQRGVSLNDEVAVKLPEPFLPDGLSDEQQRERVRSIAGRYRVQQFVRKSAVAPFVLKQAYVKDGRGRRIGHAVDLWFVAYGQLADVQNKETANEFFTGVPPAEDDSGASLRELTAKELSGIPTEDFDPDSEKYVLAQFPLLNRVWVCGVGHAQKSRTDESLLVAWEIDERFSQDETLANRWYPLETTQLGQRVRGAARPYQGYGGYVKITSLSQPKGALMFETHVVFHEPEDWFRGSNFLRSKTPLIVKENVDKLRRKLAKIRADP
jgi:hypothetical protein